MVETAAVARYIDARGRPPLRIMDWGSTSP